MKHIRNSILAVAAIGAVSSAHAMKQSPVACMNAHIQNFSKLNGTLSTQSVTTTEELQKLVNQLDQLMHNAAEALLKLGNLNKNTQHKNMYNTYANIVFPRLLEQKIKSNLKGTFKTLASTQELAVTQDGIAQWSSYWTKIFKSIFESKTEKIKTAHFFNQNKTNKIETQNEEEYLTSSMMKTPFPFIAKVIKNGATGLREAGVDTFNAILESNKEEIAHIQEEVKVESATKTELINKINTTDLLDKMARGNNQARYYFCKATQELENLGEKEFARNLHKAAKAFLKKIQGSKTASNKEQFSFDSLSKINDDSTKLLLDGRIAYLLSKTNDTWQKDYQKEWSNAALNIENKDKTKKITTLKESNNAWQKAYQTEWTNAALNMENKDEIKKIKALKEANNAWQDYYQKEWSNAAAGN